MNFESQTRGNLVGTLLVVLLSIASCPAHESEATVSQVLKVAVSRAGLELDYVTELSRPAAYLESVRIDANGDGRISAEEQRAYLQLRPAIEVLADGRPVPPRLVGEVELTMPFRKRWRFEVNAPATRWELHNENGVETAGECRIEVLPAPDVDVTVFTFEPSRDILFQVRPGAGNLSISEEPEERAPSRRWPGLAMGLAVLAGIWMSVSFRHLGWMTIALIPAVLLLPTKLDDASAIGVFRELHARVYLARGALTEVDLYNTLSRGLAEPALETIYLEMRPNLDPAQPLVRMQRIQPLETRVESSSPGGFQVFHRWRARGTVTHWGHTHGRVQELSGVYRVENGADGWRITHAEVRDLLPAPSGPSAPESPR